MNNTKIKVFLGILLFLPALVLADKNDDDFENYIDTLCNTSPFDPIFQGWTAADFNRLNNDVCAVYLPSGGVVSSGTYQSSSNIGSTGAQSQSSGSTAQQQVGSIKDRLAEIGEEEQISEGGWGWLLSAQAGESDRVETDNQSGYESDLAGIVVGGDYRFNNAFILGAAIGSTTDEASFDNNTGSLDTNSTAITMYFTYLPSEQAFVDGYIGITAIDFESLRQLDFDGNASNNVNVNGSSTARFDGSQLMVGFSGGYQYSFGDVTISPYLAIDIIETDVDGYEESGNTNLEFRYGKQESKSQVETIGIGISKNYERSWGFLVPSLDIALMHESEDDSREFEAFLVLIPGQTPTPGFKLVSDQPDRSFGLIKLGLVGAMNNGMQLFTSYEQTFSNDLLKSSAITFGVVSEF